MLTDLRCRYNRALSQGGKQGIICRQCAWLKDVHVSGHPCFPRMAGVQQRYFSPNIGIYTDSSLVYVQRICHVSACHAISAL